MNKIKQNKITFYFILISIFFIFFSLSVLCLPVLLNYNSKVDVIEKNFYKNFKIYLKSSGNIYYKPFPKPHLSIETASLNFEEQKDNNTIIQNSNLKIFIPLKDLYFRSFKNFSLSEISNSNLNFTMADIKQFREHLYKKVNKPIKLVNCKFFLRNKNDEVIAISPIKKINYKINNKTKYKTFFLDGSIFGFKFKSDWKRNYDIPDNVSNKISIYNPNIEIKNNLKFLKKSNFMGNLLIEYSQDKLNYNYKISNSKINITSPNTKKNNFQINSNIELNPFFFDGELIISNKSLETIIDNFLIKLLIYDPEFLGNINGNFVVKFKNLKNKLINRGKINFEINENKIILKKANFNINKIGELKAKINFEKKDDEILFFSSNVLKINNHIELAKIFQLSSKKIKNIKQIYFDVEKSIDDKEYLISNIRFDDINDNEHSQKKFLIKNIQNLRASLRTLVN